MPLNKEKAQDIIDDFVITNDVELNEISTQNPALFDATLNALNFLSARFGTGQKMQIVQKPMTFKKNDRFTVPHDQTGQIYMIKDIDKGKNIVEVIWFNQKENKSYRIEQSINSVIEFFNNGEWVLVDWLPLKVGDKFQNSNKRNVIYTIESINENKNKQLEVIVDDGSTKKVIDKDIDSFIEDIELGFKIPIKQEQTIDIKVGMLLKDNVYNGRIFKVTSINEASDWVELELENTSVVDVQKLSNVKEGIKNGKWEVLDELPFKVGDAFVVDISNIPERVEIAEINDDKISLNWDNVNLPGRIAKKDLIEQINTGNWRKIQTLSQPTTPTPQTKDFEFGELFYDPKEDELLEITDITSDNKVRIGDVNNKRKFLLKSDDLKYKISNGELVKVNFKIGDKFIGKDNNVYLISDLSNVLNSKTRVSVKINNSTHTVAYKWDNISENINNGTWKKNADFPYKVGDNFYLPSLDTNFTIVNIKDEKVYIKYVDGTKFDLLKVEFLENINIKTYVPAAKLQQDNPHDIKIGDLIVRTFDNVIFEVLDVNIKQDSVKLMTSSNKKETENLSVLNIKIDDGDNEKLAFSMFDTFVNPDGDFYKIMDLYSNNEKTVWVKVNDKTNFEVFQWDLIQSWVEDAYWMPATKAEADQIKADILKAEEEAKAPKKKLTKLEKQIKDLQEEIDGLLFLADEDADAKAELEKKLMQIEALKAKKP